MENSKPKFVFSCQKCGRCCENGAEIKVYLDDIERWTKDGSVHQIFPNLSISDGFALNFIVEKDEAKCKLYDAEKKECTVYHRRPLACRAFPLKFDGTGFLISDQNCPGLGQGEMTKEALEEIKSAAKNEYNEALRTTSNLPVIYSVILKEVVKRSEQEYSKLSDEEREKLKDLLEGSKSASQ